MKSEHLASTWRFCLWAVERNSEMGYCIHVSTCCVSLFRTLPVTMMLQLYMSTTCCSHIRPLQYRLLPLHGTIVLGWESNFTVADRLHSIEVTWELWTVKSLSKILSTVLIPAIGRFERFLLIVHRRYQIERTTYRLQKSRWRNDLQKLKSDLQTLSLAFTNSLISNAPVTLLHVRNYPYFLQISLKYKWKTPTKTRL